jgi:site-specific DNA recombinase
MACGRGAHIGLPSTLPRVALIRPSANPLLFGALKATHTDTKAQDRPFAVIFAAKSTEDIHGSIPTQIDDCEAMAKREGWTVEGIYSDEAASAYSGNRGDGLVRAREHAERLAAERGECALIVQHTDRLARGDGIVAQHLVEVLLWARKVGVRLRSVQDDSTGENLLMAVVMGERNHEDSKRKSASVKAGLRRSAERGEPTFSKAPDGYRIIRERNPDTGKVTSRVMVIDPTRIEIPRVAFDLALKGSSDLAVAGELDRLGYHTATGRPISATRVWQIITNPAYAGLRVHQGEVIGPGKWEPLISVEDFERIHAIRRARGGGGKRGPGRPAGAAYLLTEVATCGKCGGRMMHDTERRVRDDGTRRRRYVCRNHKVHPKGSSAYCAAAPIDGTEVDGYIAENLPALFADVQAWEARLVKDREVDRRRMTGEVERAREARSKLAASIKRREAKYVEKDNAGKDKAAEALLDMLVAERAALEPADARLRAAEAALAGVEVEIDLDPILDFATALRDEIAGRVESARGDVKRLNAVLRDTFDSIMLTASDEGVEIGPVLNRATVERVLAREGLGERLAVLGQAPTLAELDAMDLEEAEGAVAEFVEVMDRYAEVAAPPPLLTMLARNAQPLGRGRA